MSADFSRLKEVFGREALERHADQDGLTALARTVFLARGGHAPGERCPTAPEPPKHHYWCCFPEDECTCGGLAHMIHDSTLGPEERVRLLCQAARQGSRFQLLPADIDAMETLLLKEARPALTVARFEQLLLEHEQLWARLTARERREKWGDTVTRWCPFTPAEAKFLAATLLPRLAGPAQEGPQ